VFPKDQHEVPRPRDLVAERRRAGDDEEQDEEPSAHWERRIVPATGRRTSPEGLPGARARFPRGGPAAPRETPPVPRGSTDRGRASAEVTDPDAALMTALRRGDEAAYATLVRRWQDRVVSLAARTVRSAADAEDVAQEVFLARLAGAGDLRSDGGLLDLDLAITVNTSLNALRARKARRPVSGEMPVGTGEGGGGRPREPGRTRRHGRPGPGRAGGRRTSSPACSGGSWTDCPSGSRTPQSS